MSLTTAREALITEALGVMGNLVDRVEALPATLDTAREEMRDAAFFLDSRVEPFMHQIRAAVDQSTTIAIDDIRQVALEIAAHSMRQQKEAMKETARTIVREEIAPPMHQFAATLKGLVDEANRPWEAWLTHGATAIVAAGVSGWFVLHCFLK